MHTALKAAVRAVVVVVGLVSLIVPIQAHADECERVAVWREGKRDGSVCQIDAGERGLTVIDLGDDWVPPALAESPDGTGPSYRMTYLALAQERFADTGADAELAPTDRYFELYGIEPSLGVVRARLGDEVRHRCHDAIDNKPLATAPARIVEESKSEAFARITSARLLRADLDHDRVYKKLADLDALAATDRYFQSAVDRLGALERYIATVRTVQAHLACDGLFSFRPIEGGYTWQTSNAVAAYQRGAMILPSENLDGQTIEAFEQTSRERDFRAALRVLRERVVAATGLIEDGTAGSGPGTVLGRALDPEGTWRVRGHDALEGAAPDLVSAATETAAHDLGWRDAESTRAFLDVLVSPETKSRLVAIRLPPAPAYHTSAMALSVEIDRGDVWHDPLPRARDAPRRPAVVLYATDGDRRVPLVRWPTTIGGWQNEKLDGDIEKEWKESPVGHRVWRDLFVGPTWLPPRSTPDRELVRADDDHYVLAREQLGPSYRSAFGMIAFVHFAEEHERGKVVLEDEGIRTHGTGNLASLANGVSHGCHRLLGRNALRLADFVLAHHNYVLRGNAPTYYRRIIRSRGTFPVAIDSLGYRVELVPPIPVDVLAGRVHR